MEQKGKSTSSPSGYPVHFLLLLFLLLLLLLRLLLFNSKTLHSVKGNNIHMNNKCRKGLGGAIQRCSPSPPPPFFPSFSPLLPFSSSFSSFSFFHFFFAYSTLLFRLLLLQSSSLSCCSFHDVLIFILESVISS